MPGSEDQLQRWTKGGFNGIVGSHAALLRVRALVPDLGPSPIKRHQHSRRNRAEGSDCRRHATYDVWSRPLFQAIESEQQDCF